MISPDLINGLFELLGAILLTTNIKELLKHKELKGVSWIPTIFFTVWGLWNLFYYPSLGQWMSFIGGICIVTVNTIWLILIFYYKYKGKLWK